MLIIRIGVMDDSVAVVAILGLSLVVGLCVDVHGLISFVAITAELSFVWYLKHVATQLLQFALHLPTALWLSLLLVHAEV